MAEQRWKLVLDTNLLVAAFWNRRSASARILEGALEGEFAVFYTPRMRAELDLVLRNIRATQPYRERVDSFFDRAVRLEGRPAPVYTEDAEDQKFLECAAAADADYLITSDEHLLRLKSVGNTAIVTPTRFLRETHLR